jgi:Nuclear pore complex scaffold, nucleoporins 186/192/205
MQLQVNNAASRGIVESGTVHTTQGLVTLDKVPDVQEITLLADEMKLDELVALSLVLAAQQQSGAVSAAAAAGMLYEERMSAVQALLALLHAQVACGGGDIPTDIYATVATFNASLLQREENGSTVLIRRLADLIQQQSTLPPADSPLPVVTDVYSRVLDRSDIVQRECIALCQCLFYACCIKQRISGADIERLLDLLHHLSLHVRTPSPFQLAAQHQSNLVLLSVLLTLLPLEDAQGEALAEDDKSLSLLAQDAGVDAKIRERSRTSSNTIEDYYSAVVRLTWGMLPLCCDEKNLTKRGLGDVKSALRAGALGFLGAGVMGSVPMADEDEDIRLTAASVVHQLLVLFVEVAPEGMEQLKKVSTDGADAELEADNNNINNNTQQQQNANGAGDVNNFEVSMMVVDARSGTSMPHNVHIGPDTLVILLQSLATVFNARPALFLDDERRSPQVGHIMNEIGNDNALRCIPSIFLGYLDVLTALARSDVGARMIFAQLKGENAPPLVSWRRMFSTLHAVIRQYNQPHQGQMANSGSGGGGGGIYSGTAPGGGQGGNRGGISDIVLPAADTKALVAFCRLYERVMLEGSPDEVASWIRQLDDEAGVAPSWEVLFQAMCCPVPQSLKAALDSAIAAMARRPDLAAALWDRLLASVVVQPYGSNATSNGSMDSTTGSGIVPRYDLAYQLNEIESRAEDYQEALSFIQLLNSLWRMGGAALADDGRSVAHLTRFVRDELLATAFQRSFKDESQRWALVAAGLEHCRLCLEAMATVPAGVLAAELASGSLNRIPGLDVLIDLLEEKNAARAALATLSLGVDRLAGDRHTTAAGASKEAAALEALRLFHAAFQRDADFVAAARRSMQRGGYETFEAVLRHDRSRIPALMEYVRYPFNSKIQEEALRLTTVIAERTPHLVQLLLTAPGGGNGQAPIVQRLQDSFAACMHDAVSMPPSLRKDMSNATPAEPELGQQVEEEDQRAALILDLLLSSLEAPTPNLTQLLCGFWVNGGASPLIFQDPGAMHTPLRVILDVLAQPRNSLLRPRVFEQCLELIYELSDGFETGPAMLDLLRSYHGVLLPLLDTVACAPFPTSAPIRAASLHQRAWLLQLFALELRRADPVLGAQKESLKSILSSLFGAQSSEESSLPSTRGKFIDVLAIAVSNIPAEPQLGAGVSNEVRRMIQGLDVEALLSGTGTGGGDTHISSNQISTHGVGPRGDPLIDVIALKDELLGRFSEWVARHGAPGEALKEAGRAALTYAAEFNAYAEEMGGRMALLEAWQAVVCVAFTNRFDILIDLLGGSGGGSVSSNKSVATDAVLAAAEHSLQATSLLLEGPAAGLAPPLCSATEALFARLQDQALTAATLDPLSGLPLPSRLHNLFAALLTIAWEGRGQERVRLSLYNALMSYVAMCRGPALLQAPPAVISALLEGVRGSHGGSNVHSSSAHGRGGVLEHLDSIHLQLEEGNVAVLHSNIRLLQVLSQDAVSPNPALSTAALTSLAALIASDPTTALSDELHRITLPARLLQDLQDQPPEALIQPPPAGQAATLVMEAKLCLLLRLSLSGPPAHRAASAQKIYSLQALPRLAACRSLDLQPEEPGFGGSGNIGIPIGGGITTSNTTSNSLRQRLHQIVTPSLRLVLALATALPHSVAVREQTAAFVESHARAIARILRDASSSGVRGWEPSDAKLEEATLAVQLMSELAPYKGLVSPQVGPALQEAAYRAASRFLTSNAKSQSPPVVRVSAAKDAGAATIADHRTYAK